MPRPTDNFTLNVTDDQGATSSTPASFTINGVNDTPVLSVPGQTITTNEDTPINLTGAHVKDPDVGDIQTATISVAHGTLTALGTGAGLTTITGDGSNSITLVRIDRRCRRGTQRWCDLCARRPLQWRGHADDCRPRRSNANATTLNIPVTVVAINDSPVIVAGSGDSAGQALTETSSSLHASGTLTVQDVDGTDNVTLSKLGVSLLLNGAPVASSVFGLTDTQLLNNFTIPTGNALTAPATSGQFSWDFAASADSFQALTVNDFASGGVHHSS